MTIGIYKITNLLNNKVYIGQSTDIHRRWLEHLRSAQPDKYTQESNTHIHRAMQKYGVNNFKVEKLCECLPSELDKWEKRYIKYYHSTNPQKGYNKTPGGQKYRDGIGENHSQVKLTQKQVDDIYRRLLQGENVRDVYNCYKNIISSKATITLINRGKIWKKDGYAYPLSNQKNTGLKGEESPNHVMTEKDVKEIRQYYVNHSFKQVIEKFSQFKYDNIRSVVYGDSWKHLPIYKKRTKTWIEPCIDHSQSLK